APGLPGARRNRSPGPAPPGGSSNVVPVWNDLAMLLLADGVTPVPRMMLVNDLETDSGGFCELNSPLFLAVGDRIAFDGRSLLVSRASGESFSPNGEWGIRCRRGPRI
ncbi:hypothetical protein, partial [Kitasatospora sp. NPDC057936]|uniref:hypothetical protein n=1 Tax=Kitasatospora sp. NPDC057936 TaxID=3346283 RepID=UPI0036DB6AEA